MPTIKVTNALGANESANPLVGNQYEYLPWPAKVEAAILADTGGEVEANMNSGSDVLLESSPVDIKAAATSIQYPYDVVVTDIANAGERLGITIREVGGNVGPTLVRTVVWITRIV